MMSLVLPVLRADLSVVETYEYRTCGPFSVPITVFGGASDRVVSREEIEGWTSESTSMVRVKFFQGSHFLLHTALHHVMREIEKDFAVHLSCVSGSVTLGQAGFRQSL